MRSRALLALLATVVGTAIGTVVAAAPAHASLSLYRITAISPHDSTSPKTITATCDVGDTLLSVGGRVNDGAGDVLLTRAYADGALNLATAAGIEAIATTADWDIEVMAVCAPAGMISGLQLIETTAGPSTSDKFPLAACPAGKLAFGGGYKVEDGYGLASIDELRFDTALGWVQATSYANGAVGSYSLTAQAICGTPAASMSLVSWTSATNSISPKTETPPVCPAGTQTSGIGGAITGALGAASIDTLIPKPQLGAGEITVREVGAYSGSWNVLVQAVCAG